MTYTCTEREPLTADERANIDEIFGMCKDEALRPPEPGMVELVAKLARRRPIGVSCRIGVFGIRPRAPKPQYPWELFERAADNHGKQAVELYEEVRVSKIELEATIV